MQLILTLAINLGIFVRWIDGYPGGAGDDSCESLEPVHNAQPQNAESPYVIVPLADRYIPGKPFQVIIRIKDENSKPFKGFLVQARKSGSNLPVGTWSIRPGARLSQTKSCSTNDDSVTHTSPEPKIKLILIWIAPKRNLGPVTFYFTCVQEKTIFWSKILATVQEGVEYPTQRQGSINFNSWPPAANGPLWTNSPKQSSGQSRTNGAHFSSPKPTIVYDYYDYEDTSDPSVSTAFQEQNSNKLIPNLMTVTKKTKVNETKFVTLPTPLHNFSPFFKLTTAAPLFSLQTKGPNHQNQFTQSTNGTRDYYYYENDSQIPNVNAFKGNSRIPASQSFSTSFNNPLISQH